jgi:hypothetical protein
MRFNLEGEITESKRESTLAGLNGTVGVTYHPGITGQKAVDLSEATAIIQIYGQGFGFAKAVVDPLEFREGDERIAQLEAKVDGLLARVTTRGDMLQGIQRLLEAGYRLTVGRAPLRLGTGLPEV